MNDPGLDNSITVMSGLLLLFFALMGESFWSEAKYFYERILSKESKDELALLVRNYGRATNMVRLIAFAMMLSLSAVVLPWLFPGSVLVVVARIFLVILSLLLIAFLGIIASGFFFVIYPKPKELLMSLNSTEDDQSS